MLKLSRRHTLKTAPLIGFVLLGSRAYAAATPACDDDDHPTSASSEGPYFKPKSPERASLLEAGITGDKLVISGSVFSASCKPLAGIVLDFWQADGGGKYDNTGFRLRGHQFTDANGAFRLETVVPGLYPGRTRHIHVKAAAPGGIALTTQLYFPGESANGRDGLFRPDLVMALAGESGRKTGRFDFVLKVA